ERNGKGRAYGEIADRSAFVRPNHRDLSLRNSKGSKPLQGFGGRDESGTSTGLGVGSDGVRIKMVLVAVRNQEEINADQILSRRRWRHLAIHAKTILLANR